MVKLTSDTPQLTVSSHRPHRFCFIGFFLIGLMLLSCSGLPLRDARSRGIYHRVKNGETLSAIARAYQVDLQELAEINNIHHLDRIETDSIIFVPDANEIMDDIAVAVRPRESMPVLEPKERPTKKEPTVSGRAIPKDGGADGEKRRPRPPAEVMASDRPALSRAGEKDTAPRKSAETLERSEKEALPSRPKEIGDKPEQIQFDKKRFLWPVKGTVISPFGIQPDRTNSKGIRIAADEGTPVWAAADGVIIFSAPLKDYGETIIIQHEDLYATVYAHLGVRTVRGEVRVKKGDRIAFIGKAAVKEEAAIHFEIRHSNKARNPLFFLP